MRRGIEASRPERSIQKVADRDRTDPALVVFVDESGLKCLRCLRRGFRHCFIAVRSARGWVICGPLSHQTDLSIVEDYSPAELAAWYRDYGLLVVETHVRPAPLRPAPIRPFTCVEMVKRVLGLHAPWVLTPWQLYRLLTDPVGLTNARWPYDTTTETDVVPSTTVGVSQVDVGPINRYNSSIIICIVRARIREAAPTRRA